MKKITLDITYDTIKDFNETLSEITNAGIAYKVINFKGPAGGWPEVELMGSEDKLRPLVHKLTDDSGYYNDYVEEVSF